jgi:hypothetical protein
MKKVYAFEIYGNTNDTFYNVPITGTLSQNAKIYVEFCSSVFTNPQTPPGVMAIESNNCLNRNFLTYNSVINDISNNGNILFVQANSALNVFQNYGDRNSTMGTPIRGVLEEGRIHIRLRDYQGAIIVPAEVPEFKIKFVIIDVE